MFEDLFDDQELCDPKLPFPSDAIFVNFLVGYLREVAPRGIGICRRLDSTSQLVTSIVVMIVMLE